jgi:hypothetical protein
MYRFPLSSSFVELGSSDETHELIQQSFLLHAVCLFTKFAAEHFSAVKYILAYLKGTIHLGNFFSGNSNIGILSTFSDVDYAGCLQTRHATTGYVLNIKGGPVAWT